MTITFVNAGTVSSTDGLSSSPNPGLPASLANDDVLVLQVVVRGSGATIPAPSGYTEAATASPGATHRESVFYKRVTNAGAETTPTVTSTVSGLIHCRLNAWRGVNTTTQLDVATVTDTHSAANTATAPAITTVSTGAMVLWCVSTNNDNTVGSNSQGTLQYSSDTTVGADGNISLTSLLMTSAGSSGTLDLTQSVGGPNTWSFITIALRPASVAAADPSRDIGFDSIAYAIELAFGSSPLSPSPVWTDVSADVRAGDGISVIRGTNSPFSEIQTGTMSLTLNNRGRTYDPDYSSGPYYGNLVPMTPIRFRVRQASVNYPIFYGFVQGFEQGYAPPREAVCTVTAVDLFALLNTKKLPATLLDTVVLGDGPRAYWPMLEEDPLVISDFAGNGFDGLYPIETTSTDSFLQGEPTQKAKSVTMPVGQSTGLATIDPSPISTVYTVEAWVDVTAADDTGHWGINADSLNSRLGIQALFDGTGLNQPNYFEFSCLDGSGTEIARIDLPLTLGVVYHVAAVINNTATLLTMYINGQAITTADISAGTFASGSNTEDFSVGMGDGITVSTAHAALYTSSLTAAQILEHYNAGTSGGALDTAATRMATLADYAGLVNAGVYSGTNLGSNTYLGTASFSNDVLTAMQDIIRSEQGRLFVTAAGVLTAQGRVADMGGLAVNSTSNGTWADSGTLAYAGIHTLPGHVETLKNTEYVSVSGATVKSTDATATSRYGELEESVTTVLGDPTAGRNLGLSRIRRFKDPTTRIDQILIRPHGAADTRYAKVWLTDLGWRYVVSYTPQGVGSAISKTVTVEGITHVVTDAKWETTFYLVPSQDIYSTHPWFRIADATYGKLGAANGNHLPY